jgi:hypothetical protein
LETNNKDLIESMKSTRSLFEDVYRIDDTKKKLKAKLEKKYQECQNHIHKSIRAEELQKSLNSSMNCLKKKSNS